MCWGFFVGFVLFGLFFHFLFSLWVGRAYSFLSVALYFFFLLLLGLFNKLFLSQPMGIYTFSDSPPHLAGESGRGGGQVSGCVVLSCHLGLNYNDISTINHMSWNSKLKPGVPTARLRKRLLVEVRISPRPFAFTPQNPSCSEFCYIISAWKMRETQKERQCWSPFVPRSTF